MFIVSKKLDAIINMDLTNEIFIRESGMIKAKLSDGNNIPIAEYDSEKEAQIALKMLANHINSNNKAIFFMPEKEQIKAQIIHQKEQWHHAEGKKAKGHGGS